MKTAVVTGASRGIGECIALDLGRQGYHVVGTSTHEAGARDISKKFNEASVSGMGLCVRMQDPIEVWRQHLEPIHKEHPISILINNAGITRDHVFFRMSEDDWNEVLAVNLTGVFRLTKWVARLMFKARFGRIINISSVVGVCGHIGQVNYVSAKAGLIGFTKALAMELARSGITVNAVAPGFIETDMTKKLEESQKLRLAERIPQACFGQPEDIAHAVSYLVQARYVTGQTLHVNGGMHMV